MSGPPDGTDIIGELIYADAAITAIVPLQSIKAGMLLEGTPLPAILLRSLSVIDHQFLAARTKERLIERVSVTVKGRTYEQTKALIGLVRSACKDKTGDFAGCTDCSVLPNGTGPYMTGANGGFDRAQDFRVGFERDA